MRDFPGGPVVETSPSSAGGMGSTTGQGGEIPQYLTAALPPKNINNRSSIATNSIKALKMVHVQKKILKKIFLRFKWAIVWQWVHIITS